MSDIKKAIILAAGKGTRMETLTSQIPKPMLCVRNMPVLERIVTHLAAAGIEKILIITGYKAEVIEEYFKDGSRWNCSIQFKRQLVQDGTGRVVELGRDFVGNDSFLLVYGDILVKPETYVELIGTFRKQNAEGIITVKLGEDITKGGLLLFDEDLRLKDLVEKPSPEELKKFQAYPHFKPWYNAGLYAFTASLFPHIKKLKKSVRGEYELTDAIRTLAKESENVFGMEIEGYWIDVRDPELLSKADSVVT